MTLPVLPDEIWQEIYAHIHRAQYREVMQDILYINDCWTTMDYSRKDEKIIADTFWEACYLRDFQSLRILDSDI